MEAPTLTAPRDSDAGDRRDYRTCYQKRRSWWQGAWCVGWRLRARNRECRTRRRGTRRRGAARRPVVVHDRYDGRGAMHVARGDAVALARELVAIDSRNPSLVPNGPGEAAVAHALADVLRAWSFRVDVYDVAPGRPNVVARVGGDGSTPGELMFNG